MYFYYQKTITSRWSPMKSSEKPSKKTSEGCQLRPITTAIELPPHMWDYPLDRLMKIYPSSDL